MGQILFQAKIEEGIIYVWAVGKWRPMREYRPKGKIPSKKLQAEILRSVWVNCGKSFNLEEAELIFKSE